MGLIMLLEQVHVSRAEEEGLPPSRIDCAYLSRFRRLTPRQVRLLILTVQDGLSYRELSEALGVTRGNVATTMQSIRRKLAVPRRQDLGGFVQDNPTLAAALFGSRPEAVVSYPTVEDRRRKDLLRVTVEELKAVALRARHRAASLERLPVLDDDEAGSRGDEASLVRQVAELVDTAAGQGLTAARQRGLNPLPLPTGSRERQPRRVMMWH